MKIILLLSLFVTVFTFQCNTNNILNSTICNSCGKYSNITCEKYDVCKDQDFCCNSGLMCVRDDSGSYCCKNVYYGSTFIFFILFIIVLIVCWICSIFLHNRNRRYGRPYRNNIPMTELQQLPNNIQIELTSNKINYDEL